MLSDEYYTMHLTPHGWVDGTEKNTNSMVLRPIPDDTMFTLVFHKTIDSILSQPKYMVEVKYQIDSKSDMLKILFATFGKLPDRFQSWKMTVDW